MANCVTNSRFVFGRTALAVLSLLMLAAPSWVYIGPTADNRNRVFVDVSSVEMSSGVARVWLKFDFSKNPAEIARYSLKRVEMRCAERTFRFIASTDYSPSGSIIFSDEREDLPFSMIVPDSIGSRVYDVVCR